MHLVVEVLLKLLLKKSVDGTRVHHMYTLAVQHQVTPHDAICDATHEDAWSAWLGVYRIILFYICIMLLVFDILYHVYL